MFTSNVYRVMIGCPGDIIKEVEIAKEVIIRWTSLHAEQNKVVLLPINWASNSYPAQGAHPQKLLNKQIVDKSDLLVGIFGARIGSPTDTSPSGTIEEIEEHNQDGKPIMLFFRKFNNATSEELSKLESFKNSIKDKYLYHEYNQVQDFESCFTNALELFLSDNWLKGPAPANSDASNFQNITEFSEKEIEIVRKWVDSGNNSAYLLPTISGTVYVIGNQQYIAKSGREKAEMEDFISRLQKVGFIIFVRNYRQGSPIYELQMKAYKYFENLRNENK